MTTARPGLARWALLAVLLAVMPACRRDDPDAGRPASARGFPRADRASPSADAPAFATEALRDAQGEAREVMRLARIEPGMTVADIGAGEGYYTMRLAPAVGRKGRVLAEDIDRAALARLGDRVTRERLDNISIKQGDEADPRLPAGSFDRVFLVHMYHEVESPYAFLWHLRDGVKPDGEVVVVDSNRPVKQHGIPPRQLQCEFAALNMTPVRFSMLTGGEAYLIAFRAAGPKPAPDKIKACES